MGISFDVNCWCDKCHGSICDGDRTYCQDCIENNDTHEHDERNLVSNWMKDNIMLLTDAEIRTCLMVAECIENQSPLLFARKLIA